MESGLRDRFDVAVDIVEVGEVRRRNGLRNVGSRTWCETV